MTGSTMKLKRFRLLISTLLVLPVILIVSACSETPDNIEETYRGTAFSALSVTANNGETVTATTVDEKISHWFSIPPMSSINVP